MKGSRTSLSWTFVSQAKLRLPIVCFLNSDKINCDSINLQSSQTKEIHLSHYRIQIMEQTFEEEKININKTTFVKTNIPSETHITPAAPSLTDTLKWPLIGTGAAAILIIILTFTFNLVKKHSSSGAGCLNQCRPADFICRKW